MATERLTMRQIREILRQKWGVGCSHRQVTASLRVSVGNTLANQACEQTVIDEARERGWCNAYLERAMPMMREELRSGLVGPVRVMVGILQPG